MEFRAYATHETASAVERLMASQAEAQIRRAREALEAAARALDTTVAPVGADDEVRDLVQRLEAAAGIAVQRVQQEAQTALEAVREELEAARRENDEIGALVASLRGQLATQTDRASTAESDLDATIEAHRQIEMELGGMRELLEATRSEAAKLAMDLEAENAQRAIITADLAITQETQARLEAALAAAEAAAAEDADARATLAGDFETARARLADLEESRTALRGELEASRSAREAAETERDMTQAALVTAAAEQDATRSALAAAEGDLASSRAALTAVESELATSQTAFTAAERDLATSRAALTAAEADLGASQTALTAAQAARDRSPLIEAAATACRELTSITSVDGLLSALVSQVSTQFTRTAIFRAKAHHLEGEHAVGFDAATDVSKLVVPLTLDSILTRACSSGALACLGPGDAPGGAAPFADSPHLAVAVPIVFQGEVLAVLYADAEDPPAGRHDERPAFASVLADHATLLLARMSQELKALHELGDYAGMLLQEAEQMYAADVEAGRTEAERRRRLQDSIDCARQLYAQRAALEGASAAGLFDERISAAISAASASPFGRDLALAAGPSQDARRNAS